LKRSCKRHEKAGAAQRGRYYPLNVRFHDLLAQFTATHADRDLPRLVNELHLYRRETLAHGPDSFPTSTHEHLAIVEAVPAEMPSARPPVARPRDESRERLAPHARRAGRGTAARPPRPNGGSA
jgi:DNA-binding GntR family transcriptional regulator